ncbi:hypothetical protein ACP70R_034042 [Stipagrostis hirtigluma subsp. patula]
MPRAMAATLRLLLLCLAAAATAGVLQARAQLDSIGFISIDCGLPGTASYVDDTTKIPYAPDAAFTEAGTNHNISRVYVTPQLSRLYLNVRSFPDGARNCYTLRTFVAGLKYLLRATFMYGDYDGLGRPPIFDLYAGVNFWSVVNVTAADKPVILEAIVLVPGDSVQVCLVNTGSGTPFMSGLDLRPLKSTLYQGRRHSANATQGLVLLGRLNFGPTEVSDIVRYPDDPHDRIWTPWVDDARWRPISTAKKVINMAGDEFEAPPKVMQTAITPRNASGNIEFYWLAMPQPRNPAPGYLAVMHFAELEPLSGGTARQFYINLNGKLWGRAAFTPQYLRATATYNVNPPSRHAWYSVSINATANSTRQPIINAIEVFSVFPTNNVGTDSQDVSAITAIRENYQVKKNWIGDPCVPKTLAWGGLTCSYAISSPPRITSLNMSFSGLNGDISSSFANLKAVQYVDLSHNNLTGPIPDALSQLPSLTVLDLTDNQLSGSIPPGLQKRIQDGSLNLRYGTNPNLCTNADSCRTAKRKSKLAVYIAIAVLLVFVIISVVVLLLCLLRRKNGATVTSNEPTGDAYAHSSLHLENRRFTYGELEAITKNFQRILGRGGFGYVYHGSLEDGTQVAVKLRSDSSNQGVREFLAEAQILTRIHHKNLVSMVGYCKDGEYMALVYEYMSEGTLQEHIAGNNGRFLTWRMRLRIALESAQGLEYLHRGCNPPLIHRDVKATNILLNEKLEAKIADFGLSKPFNRDDGALPTNTLVGTPGYVDPEYVDPSALY